MLEKGSYVPWASRFLRFLNNKQEEGERMLRSIEVGPYVRKMIQNPDKPDDPNAKIIEPLSKMTVSNKQQYFSDIKVMHFLFQGIPNDIYNSVYACTTAKKCGNGSEESLSSVYERLTTLVNVMERNNIHPLSISINTKFLNSLQPKAKKAARNHDPLALVAHSNVHSSHSHASPSYSHSPQPYYVTHPSSVIDYEEDYQRKIQWDTQEDKLTTAMMLLATKNTQRYSTPTNNHLRTSSNIKNQVETPLVRLKI
ncbi:hypothetical protein Tco_1110338 [Tanacetum coccineum]|uniref:Uncharacterized protein n=1 Tax=Tanacetum coccineum TaxID=301880 RepID=A0ABQ5IIK7_9ASTR